MPPMQTALPIQPHEIAQALPLVQPLVPGLGLDRWRDFAQELLDGSPDQGIDVVRNIQGYLVGLVAYRVIHDLHHRRVLRCDQFVALDLILPEGAAHTLAQAMELRARTLGCSGIQTNLMVRQGSTRDLLRSAGYRDHATVLFKPLAP